MRHRHHLPELPLIPPVATDEGRTCPALLDDGSFCGEDMAYAHNIREYHPVRSWGEAAVVLGESTEFDASEEEDEHLWCAAGHDWAVPGKVEFE